VRGEVPNQNPKGVIMERNYRGVRGEPGRPTNPHFLPCRGRGLELIKVKLSYRVILDRGVKFKERKTKKDREGESARRSGKTKKGLTFRVIGRGATERSAAKERHYLKRKKGSLTYKGKND